MYYVNNLFFKSLTEAQTFRFTIKVEIKIIKIDKSIANPKHTIFARFIKTVRLRVE